MQQHLRSLLRKVASWFPPRVLAAYDRYKTIAIEREHLQEFQRFYRRLPDKKDVFYMFCTSGLLHWVARSLSFVPPSVNVVLIGSNLQPEELTWIAENVRRPFHHIRLWTDDKAVWEFLFKTNEHNFGWLDIDCFVLSPELFRTMAKIDPDAAINCTWSFVAPGGASLLCTFFLFVNAEVIRAVNRHVAVSPVTYSYQFIWRPGRPSPYALCEIPSARLTRLLRLMLPSGERRRPVYTLPDARFYDTLHVYQLAANALGFRLHKVRSLAAVEQHSSSELVHVGRVSYYRRWKDRTDPGQQRVFTLLSQIEYAVLCEMAGELPPLYDRMKEEIRMELEKRQLSTDLHDIKRKACDMMAAAGADYEVISRIVGLDEELPLAAEA